MTTTSDPAPPPPAAPPSFASPGRRRCPQRVDKAAQRAVHLLDPAGGRREHGRLRCPALRFLRAQLHRPRPPTTPGFDPAGYSLSGFFLAQLAIGTLGVVVITSEYQTGSIRATLAATPQRPIVLAAKAAVFATFAAVTGIVASLASFLVGQAILSDKDIQTHLSDPGALRTVLGGGLYLALVGLLGLGIGTLIRRTAGAIATLVGLIVILPVLRPGPTGHLAGHHHPICALDRRSSRHRPNQVHLTRPTAHPLDRPWPLLRLHRGDPHRRHHCPEPTRRITCARNRTPAIGSTRRTAATLPRTEPTYCRWSR